MKKFFVCFIVGILLLAFIIGNCSDDGAENNNQNLTKKYSVENDDEIKKSNKKSLEDISEDTFNNNYYTHDYDTIAIDNPMDLYLMSVQILKRHAYTASYNNETKCSNWVAWHLTRDRLENKYLRKGVPYYDNDGKVIGIGEVATEMTRNGYIVDLDVDSPRQELDDYKNVNVLYNLSHGHMCPAGDNVWSKVAINQSFLLTNICPQDKTLNNGAWRRLEEKCRTWTNRYGNLYIVAGPIFYNGVTKTIGANRVAVPDAFFKVLLCLVGNPKSIGFIYPNDSGSYGWEKNCCPVDSVEAVTGFDFFSELPDSLENEIESECDTESWK